MAKKHKHEEHVNHERWLVSFADMMTLLFALFVVLYALAATKREEDLERIKKSIMLAFHIEGEGKTNEDGLYLNHSGGGELPQAAPLLTAQDGPMTEFLEETLTKFERVAGRSLEVNQTDDSVALRAPLSSFFPHERARPLDPDIYNWLVKVARGATTFAGNIRVVIETPNVVLPSPDGRRWTSVDLCHSRLATVRKVLVRLPEIQGSMVQVMLNELAEKDEIQAPEGDWQDRAIIAIVFSNGV